MQSRRQEDFAIYMENKAGVWGQGQMALLFFLSSPPNSSVPPTSSKFCLFSKGDHECCLGNASPFFRVVYGNLWLGMGGRKRSGKSTQPFCRAELSSDQIAGQPRSQQGYIFLSSHIAGKLKKKTPTSLFLNLF